MPGHADRSWITRMMDWRTNAVLPLWTGAGVDHATSSVWEALDHQGRPCTTMNRRQRVQFRQAYAFARNGNLETRALAWSIFRRTMDHGFHADTQRFATWVDPSLNHLDQNHDLYDLVFGILAVAALGTVGYDVAADIAKFERSLTMLQAPLGWYETVDRRMPRRQNPHMHLFEAAVVLYAFTGDATHRNWAQTCLDLAGEYFTTSNGTLLEFFDENWLPLTGVQQSIEPGHMMEWIYLCDQYETVTGCNSGISTDKFWDAAIAYRMPSGFLPDRMGVSSRRLWPQTEFLKAALVRAKTRTDPADHNLCRTIGTSLMDTYLAAPINGGWYDQFDENGKVLSVDMPASTYYHIDLAIDAAKDYDSNH